MKYFRSVPAGLVVMVLVAGASGAATPERSPAIGAYLLPFQLQLDPQVENDGLTLSVSGPDNFYYRQSFAVSEPVVFSLEQDGASLADGVYTWEAVLTPRLGGETLRAMAEARAGGDESAEGRLRAAGKLPAEPMIDYGSFRIHQGAILTDQGPERAPASDAPSGGMTRVASPDVVRVAAADFVIADDLIVDGSACIGFDCVNGESFGFDTIRLKENNLRIKFDDTSTASGFPNRDWQLTANDSASGGRNKFSIDDITGGRTPFTIEAAAPSNSLYVDDAGRVGFGTSNPVLELHVSNGDSPALRLEQNTSSGFAAQTWDIAGNETNLFVRDVTNGSTLPFRIRPGAPSSSLFIDSDGHVGVGTASPDADLHVRSTDAAAPADGLLHIENASTTSAQRVMLAIENNGAPQSEMRNTDNGITWRFGQNNAGDFVINDTADLATAEMQIGTNGDIRVNGTLVHSSSRTVKEGLSPVDPSAVLALVRQLPILRWSYIHDPARTIHIGPMAEDFYEAFGVGPDNRSIALNDTIGVALASVQGLYELVEVKDAQISDLEARIAALEKLLESREISP
jgi:hypothetical protein